MTSSFYLPETDGSFTSTSATTSPWNDRQQHGGPPTALLARAIEGHDARAEMAIVRLSVDFLGAIPQGRMSITVQTLRPGRRIELVEAQLSVAERVVVVARAWRSHVMVDAAPAIVPVMEHVLPGPQEQRFLPGVSAQWGYGHAVEWRFARSGFDQPGPALAWARPRIPLVDGESTSGLQRALIVADSTNGVSAELPLEQWLFVPPTLTVTTFREPTGPWVLLDAQTMVDARGTGLAHATLSDQSGPFGVASQPLLVARR